MPRKTSPALAPTPSSGHSSALAVAPPLADCFVHIHSSHTSLELLSTLGSLSRERLVDRAISPLIKHLVLVTYGTHADLELAATIPPKSWDGSVACIANEDGRETALFQASISERVVASLASAGCRSALIYTDQHDGGEVAVQTATLLRSRGLRVGLVARCGYHWSWTVARDTSPNDPRAIAAAAREGDLCRAADVVVATTRRIADALCWQHARAAGSIRVVPNFVKPEAPVPPFSKREPGAVLFAGRLAPEKRIDLLIRAVTMAARTNPALRLIVIGDGPQRDALRALAESFHAPVEFRERVSHAHLLREMGRCNVYAQPSRFEGHPKTILEAMAMGAPTLVTRAPGVDDEINPNVTGIISGDAEPDLCAALVWLVANPAIAQRLGDRAARDIRARLSFDALFTKLLDCFREAMLLAGAHACDRHPATPVRWEQTLLNAGPDAAAAQFSASIAAYAKRLDPRARAIFMDSIAARLGSLAEARCPAATPAPDVPAPRR